MLHAFTHWRYYPSGGMGDYLGAFETSDDARAAIRKRGADEYEIAQEVDGVLTTVWSGSVCDLDREAVPD